MKNSVNRLSWLWLAVFPALAAALIWAGCDDKPEEPCVGCGVVPPEPPCDTCGNPPGAACDTCPTPPEPFVCATTVTGGDFTETVGGLDLEMAFVKCGTMKIGCTDEQVGCLANERYAHDVEISAYYIGKFLVTQRQWTALMGTNPSYFTGEELPVGMVSGEDLPVEMVSWDDAKAFIDRLNERSSRKKYRLPTNAEWEYAARGGVNSKGYRYSGSNNPDDVAWHDGNSGGSNFGSAKPVGTKDPNELGLYDMSGNVYEWVNDWWEDNRYERETVANPQGPETGVRRVVRGGSWAQDTAYCRVSARTSELPSDKRKFIGFRVAVSAE